jgi:hypothetical protein
MRKPHRVVVAAATVAAAVAGWGAIMPRASAELDASSQWSASSRADALAIEFLNTNAPVFGTEPIIYGTPASAHSLVDANGQSNAWAAAPYPGDIMVGAADNGNGALAGAGLPPIFSSYPFYVTSEYPRDEESVQDQSGNRLEAYSQQYSSSSEARSGLITGDFLAALQAQASSTASVNPDTGELVALADSRLDAFRFTDMLQIGKSTAHAKVTRLPDQEIVKESSFTLGSIVVNGVEMSYGDEGFKFADQQGEAPGDPKPLFDALKQAGITVEILPAQGTDTSVESAGLRITQVVDYSAGKQQISFIIGRVSAAITGEARPATGNGIIGGPLPDTGTQDSSAAASEQPAPPAAPAPDASAVTDPAPAVELAAGAAFTSRAAFTSGASSYAALPDLSLPKTPVAVPPVVEAVNPQAAQAGQAAAPAPAVRLVQPASLGRGLRDDDISGFYAAAAALAALLTAGAFALRGGGRAARTAAGGASVLKLPNS